MCSVIWLTFIELSIIRFIYLFKGLFYKKNVILKTIFFWYFKKDVFHYILSPNILSIGVIWKVWGGEMWTCMETA